jgi:hypothetical protein
VTVSLPSAAHLKVVNRQFPLNTLADKLKMHWVFPSLVVTAPSRTLFLKSVNRKLWHRAFGLQRISIGINIDRYCESMVGQC